MAPVKLRTETNALPQPFGAPPDREMGHCPSWAIFLITMG